LEYGRQVNNCYKFQDMAPFYEHVLGKAELSPDEEAAARGMSVEQCMPVARYAQTAQTQRVTCLRALDEVPADFKGKLPMSFKDTYGSFPIDERPLVKACAHRRDVIDAMLKESGERQGIRGTMRTDADGGVRIYPEGATVPPPPTPSDRWR
jgi:hypothetical protein